jgi:glycosyltransferase involved in cell wall biosynthesis
LLKISATVVALNEEANLPRAIESLRCCDEIVVIDSGSSDRTIAIAARLGARVIESEWRGYAAQKNFAAEQAMNDWILSIDADEALSESLEAEIWEIKRGGPHADAYTIPRMAQYMGRWILHCGWYPDRKVRLYDRRKARWVGEYVHESVEVSGKVAHLNSNLLHYTCASLSQHLKTTDRYTTLAAQELVAQRSKVPLWRLLVSPPWAFFKTYFIQRGFQDGFEGLVIAYMAAVYVFVKYAKARSMS